MRMLLLGGNGQVGWELRRALAPLGELIALGRKKQDGLCGDLSCLKDLKQTVAKVKPDFIVNAAAYTAVDQAESEPELAQLINSKAPAVLASAAIESGAWLVHYSSDYVFNGGGETPWKETDPKGPLNVYGKTKLAGEKSIQKSGCKHLIFRTSWVYAAHGNNFIKTILRLAPTQKTLPVINDQFGAPTGAELIADITAHSIQTVRNDNMYDLSGVYHLTAAGEATWHEYARFVLKRARQAVQYAQISEEGITPVTTKAFPTAAQRPLNSRLNCTSLKQTFNITTPDWRQGVERVVSELCHKIIKLNNE